MNLRLRSYELKLKTFVAIASTLIAMKAFAAPEGSGLVEDQRHTLSDLVEVRMPIEIDKPYREHRETSGFMVGLNYENTQMFNYVSIVDLVTPFSDLFGDIEIPIYNLNLGYKYNFLLGSLVGSLGGGYGTYTSNDSGTDRSLSLTKYSVALSYIADTLFSEPYVAPYVTIGLNQFDITERAGDVVFETGIQAAPFYTAGVLLQLNWLDNAVARKALVDYGLENTYVDLFVTQFQPSLDPVDPNTETEFTFGAGLRLEF